MSAILTLWHLLNLWHKTDLGGPTWVIMQGLLSLFMNLILVGMLGRYAESGMHRVVRQVIGELIFSYKRNDVDGFGFFSHCVICPYSFRLTRKKSYL